MTVLPGREALLHEILASLIAWRGRMAMDEFIQAWEQLLAFRGRLVQIWEGSGPPMTGKLLGLEQDGSLRIEGEDGNPMTVYFGDVRLRPAV
jgi:biotin-(acetyl-CoA carboxylase) ligase